MILSIYHKKYVVLYVLLVFLFGCSKTDEPEEIIEDDNPIVYADIDFSHWKVTLPIDEDDNGSPDEYHPDELINFGYRNIPAVQTFMYDDPTDASIVFYTYPDVATTNSTYSRTELRELINPNNSKENWTLAEGGILTGKLKVDSISEDTASSSQYHRVIVMQIHGIISEEDMAIHGFTSNNGPPLLKMYWKDGELWAHKKSLIDESTTGDDLLDVSSDTWYDIKHNFGDVGFDAFELQITASEGRLSIRLNDEEAFVYEDISLAKWPFENYFKAGNYLVSTNPQAESYIKYYELTVNH